MDNGIRDTVAGQWHAYLGGITTLALAGDAPPPAGSSPGEAVLRGAEAWARQGPWASGLFAREPTRVMVITGFGGSDGDLSRAIAVRLAAGFLHGQRGVPLPLRITMRGRQDGEGARELLSRHLGQAGLTIADWRRLNVPTLVTIDGLDDLLPAGRPLPAREELGLVSSLCSHELSQSRIVLVTARQPDETRLWRLVTDRLDEGAGLITVLDSTSGRSGSGASVHFGSRNRVSPWRAVHPSHGADPPGMSVQRGTVADMDISVDLTKMSPGSDGEKTVTEVPVTFGGGPEMLIIDPVPVEGPMPLQQDHADREAGQ